MSRYCVVLSLLLGWAAAEAAAEEGRSALLLYKKLSQTEGHSLNTPFNVTITVFNRGKQRRPL